MTDAWEPETSLDPFLAEEQAVWDDRQRALEERELDHGKRSYRPDPKPVKRLSRREANGPQTRELRLRWREAIFNRDQGCVFHANRAECADGFEAHHAVEQQTLRKIGQSALWDPRSGVCVCGLAHRRHTDSVEAIPFEVLPDVVVEFLTGLGLGVQLERSHPRRREAA